MEGEMMSIKKRLYIYFIVALGIGFGELLFGLYAEFDAVIQYLLSVGYGNYVIILIFGGFASLQSYIPIAGYIPIAVVYKPGEEEVKDVFSNTLIKGMQQIGGVLFMVSLPMTYAMFLLEYHSFALPSNYRYFSVLSTFIVTIIFLELLHKTWWIAKGRIQVVNLVFIPLAIIDTKTDEMYEIVD